jgi:predicted phosphatase
MLSFEERKNRILNTKHVVYINDMTVHIVNSVDMVGNIVYINTSHGLMLQDLEVFTLKEAGEAERFIEYIKKHLIK